MKDPLKEIPNEVTEVRVWAPPASSWPPGDENDNEGTIVGTLKEEDGRWAPMKC